ncbi:phosphatidylglycerophosphatase A [Roseovarius sp. SYSU LYC5161]|uniref:phosphatidylglycerophosphatase A family protein n=1 Tax=Roseovarius halophilus (ex Wu et al. 2025) TaxID=3376060 RepID=UPI00287250B1|nr:phosphatidylglycerophosphatase A [Roseovarius sp.]
MTLQHLFVTVLGIGHLRPAPGTWGSLAALPFAWALHALGGFPVFVAATVLIFGLGWWATYLETKGKSDHDPSEIVIDEIAGQWVAFLPVSLGAAHTGAPLTALWPGWIVAFLAFRFFDILKVGPIGWADRRGDSLGVMLDDVLAGIAAALVVIALAALSHGVLMQ